VNVELERNSHRSFFEADWGRRERGTVKLYGDEGASAFFRRLEFSPDGGVLVSPAGKWEDPWDVGMGYGISAEGKGKGKGKSRDDEVLGNGNGEPTSGKKKRKTRPPQLSSAGGSGGEKPTVYLYGRAAFAAGKPPLAHLPGHRTSSVAIRFSPVVYELREGVKGKNGTAMPLRKRKTKVVDLEKGKMVEVSLQAEVKKEDPDADMEGEGNADEEKELLEEPASVFALPYRMMYAVATHDTVMVYDTQQAGPVCMFGNLHYASFTDVAWYAPFLS